MNPVGPNLQVDILDFINGPPGILESSASLYADTCYGNKADWTKWGAKDGYLDTSAADASMVKRPEDIFALAATVGSGESAQVVAPETVGPLRPITDRSTDGSDPLCQFYAGKPDADTNPLAVIRDGRGWVNLAGQLIPLEPDDGLRTGKTSIKMSNATTSFEFVVKSKFPESESGDVRGRTVDGGWATATF